MSSTNLSFGSGAIGGLGGGFGDYVGGLRKVGLDLVLVIDTTESMQFVIKEVKTRLTSWSRGSAHGSHEQVGIVVYRDQGDEYVVKWTDLSFRTAKVARLPLQHHRLRRRRLEEAVLDALDAAITRCHGGKKSKRIIILVWRFAPACEGHGELDRAVTAFHAAGGSLNTIDVTSTFTSSSNG